MTRPEELFSKVLGTAIIPDLSGFTDRVYSISSDERTALWSHLYQDCGLDKDQRSITAKSVLNAFDSFFPKRTSGFFGPELAEKLYKEEVDQVIAKLKKLCDYAEEFEQPLQYFYHDDTLTAIGCAGRIRYLIPGQCVSLTTPND